MTVVKLGKIKINFQVSQKKRSPLAKKNKEKKKTAIKTKIPSLGFRFWRCHVGDAGDRRRGSGSRAAAADAADAARLVDGPRPRRSIKCRKVTESRSNWFLYSTHTPREKEILDSFRLGLPKVWVTTPIWGHDPLGPPILFRDVSRWWRPRFPKCGSRPPFGVTTPMVHRFCSGTSLVDFAQGSPSVGRDPIGGRDPHGPPSWFSVIREGLIWFFLGVPNGWVMTPNGVVKSTRKKMVFLIANVGKSGFRWSFFLRNRSVQRNYSPNLLSTASTVNLPSFIWFYWVLGGFVWFYWVLRVFTWFHMVLPRFVVFLWVLLGFIEYDWVWLSLNKILPGYT